MPWRGLGWSALRSPIPLVRPIAYCWRCVLCRIDCRKDTAEQLHKKVAQKLQTFLTQKGNEIVKKHQESKEKSEGKQDDAHAFVRQLMTLHDQYRVVVKEHFKDIVVFQKNFKEVY